ncbi:MAG: iron-sulfur cluster carrier protein ApbC [Bacteroidota bacterium]|nr:iron-sulfur cluster carrier protein ApbC [Bacteroidota bacterium]MDP4234776.1 iron-sulfur cluster carrier protein ApbC [Bacteroidota bacterium]MDP4244144.1 iron-sulfur cluster carrier protein ApbC [Bacteroidota bacterium]MDP4289300.1 iron-sulfur cluster carrier protein ApbC [Bacteroidota bacterium]
MGLFSKSSATPVTESDILHALSSVVDPDIHRDVVSLGMIKDVVIKGSKVGFTFELTTPSCPIKGELEREAREAVESIAGAGNVEIKMTARVPQSQLRSAGEILSGVKNTIAIASGKGGVGKSTVAANLAVQLARDGARVGLLDADIYGPSIPLMFGLQNAKPAARQVSENKVMMVPLEAEGIKIMSIGFLVDPDTAVVWRGPMASGALKQFMTDVDWGELDYLLFDLPPGTGDIQLTLVQSISLSGALIVTTPQDIALADATKGIRMFEKVHVPVLGIVENMSYFVCSHCGEREEIFAHGGGRTAAKNFGVPFLGELPLTTEVRIGSDTGHPIVATSPDSTAGKAFADIACELARQVSILAYAPEHAPVQIEI